MSNQLPLRPEVSVITPYHNAGKTILPLLHCLARQDADFPWEVVFVDNRSTDNSTRVIQEFTGDLPDHQGIRAGRGQIILFCDADDEVPDSWIRKMREGVERHDFIGCAINDRHLNPHYMHGIMHTSEEALTNYGYLPFSFTGALGIRKSLLERVGGFDEVMQYSMDVDLCFRIQLTGVCMHFWPETQIYYRLRTSLIDWMRQAFRWCRAGKVMSRRYSQYGHPPIVLNWRLARALLKHSLIFILRFHDPRKRLIYGKLVAQNLAFMLPPNKEAKVPIKLNADLVEKKNIPLLKNR